MQILPPRDRYIANEQGLQLCEVFLLNSKERKTDSDLRMRTSRASSLQGPQHLNAAEMTVCSNPSPEFAQIDSILNTRPELKDSAPT